ncbi:glycosyltransferase family 4 protein [Neorhodopirellula pilleata]|uniref:Alpha-D-kanosaminyltransferase n=1 Tax=Neorhodopirellula pilleata TaxID=2714738 RepID=A0A5C6A923_9BACT|nr:glycosyltransferase family 4 protein [Neorhodopirellula pilleata]TWT96474.1 Alpha-D-kanosaminyltransferase [Neorhodopirellula pilleata]
MNSKRPKLIVLGQTPPPLHGQAVAIKTMIDGLSERLDMIHVPMQFSETVFDNGRLGLHKVTHLLSILCKTLWLLVRYPGSVLYYPPAPASWVPVLRDLAILSIARPFASKTIFHFHAHGLGKFLADRKWLSMCSWAWRKPDSAVVLGLSCVDDANLFMPQSLSIVPYGIDLVAGVRRRPHSTKTVVLYVGMLAEEKGIFDLLDTANHLRDQNIEFRLVGTYKHSETQPNFEARRAELGLEDSVITVGRRSGDELWQEYADADIFFFPTHFETETFGVVILEAMAHRLPVVASRWRGPKDIVQDGVTGFLSPPYDPQSFSDSIRRLSNDRELRSRMGSAGHALCREKYTLENYLLSMEKVFVQANCAVKTI